MNRLLFKSVSLVTFFLLINLPSLAQLNPSLPPSSNFNLTGWNIHTLDSNYNFIEIYTSQLTAGYTSEFFYTNPTDGSMVFRVPSNGQPTSSATYPRSELRQSNQGANWLLADTTTHQLQAQCKVMAVATAKPQTVIGQIHGGDAVSQMLKLRWTGYLAGQCYIEAQFKTNDTNKADNNVKLVTGLSLGDLITYKFTMKAGLINVTVNGYSTSTTYTSQFFGSTDRYYFKAGDYLQYVSTDSTIYGLNQFYKLVLDSSSEVLPVELTSFTANIINGAVNLKWITATEVNNVGFDIERKSDTTNWKKIGYVPGKGNSNNSIEYSFNDRNIISNKFTYRLRQIDKDGKSIYSKTVEIVVPSPDRYELFPNYPNPFNPSTTINYSLAISGNTKLSVYNSLGSKVATILDEYKPAGNYSVQFNGSNLASGIYLFRLESGNYSAARKFILMK